MDWAAVLQPFTAQHKLEAFWAAENGTPFVTVANPLGTRAPAAAARRLTRRPRYRRYGGTDALVRVCGYTCTIDVSITTGIYHS